MARPTRPFTFQTAARGFLFPAFLALAFVGQHPVAARAQDSAAEPAPLPKESVESGDPAAQAKPGIQPQGPASVADLADGLLDAVVNISSSQTIGGGGGGGRVAPPQVPDGSPFEDFFDQFFNDQEGGPQRSRKVDSLGSGFVIDPSGVIVTNNHVIEDADDVEVNFADGSTRKAEVVGVDTKTDLAVLKVEASQPLAYVAFGDSQSMRIGDWVMAIGNPFGLGGTVTIGIVSARGRNINAGPYDNFIQTDAAINRGNSGGPLFNMKGEVIGINTAIISPSGGSIGIGFSVPSELATNVIDQLREFGETRRGWLGVRIQPVTDDIAESLGMDTAKGALVAGIINGGPVDDGSIEAGDVIVRFDGKDVEEMRDLPLIVAESPVGKEVKVDLVRKGKPQTVTVTLGRLEDTDSAGADSGDTGNGDGQSSKTPAENMVFGMTLGALDDAARKTFKIADDVDGVVVTKVEPGSPAAEKRIAAGNVIVEIAQEEVSEPSDVAEHIASLKEDGRRNALLMLADKAGELRFVTIRIE